MSNRHALRLTLACVAAALVAAFGAGAGASGGLRSSAPAAAGTFVLTDFGAAGDGVTDDGPALQAALDALAEAGGGTLLVPAGRYAIVTPVSKNFGGLAAPVNITGVPSATEPPSPDGDGQELTRGLDLTSEFLPRTGESASAVSIGGLQSLTVQELAFVGTPDVTDDALVTLFFHDVGDVSVRHCEFYGLASMDGAIVMARRSSLRVERSVFLGCATSGGTYSSVVQNIEWKGVSVTDTVFTDYGQRPELFGKLVTAPFSWVNLGNTAALDTESPRREAVFRDVFFDEGGMSAVSSTPARFQPPGPPIDLLYVSTLRMNVSNLRTSGLYLTDLRGALVEDGRFGWSQNSHSAVSLTGVGSAILSRVACADSVTRVLADSTTARFVAVDVACPEIVSDAPVTRVFNAATPDDDPVRYVTARFLAALGRDPDPAAHFYWADRLLRCGTDAACVTGARAALAAYLASNPQPTFALEGRATDEAGAPLAGVSVTLSGSQTVSTSTGADGRYRFGGLPTSGAYTVAASKRHHTFAAPQQSVVAPAGARVVDFGATLNRHQIAGRVTDGAARGVAGATVALGGSRAATTTTDANGGFSFSALPAGGNYTVTPSSPSYSFSPSPQSVSDLGLDVFLAFGATPLFNTISGQVVNPNNSPLGGVNVSLGGGKVATATTNPQGFFLFAGLPRGGNYTVTPGTTLGYTFGPASKSFANLTSDQGTVFVGTPTDFKVGGRVTSGGAGVAGVGIAVTGSQTAATTTDANGAYSLSLAINGNYTLTPSKQHYTFAPAATTVSGLVSDRTADFAATLNRHKITGRVARPDGRAMPGVTLALSGAHSATATTDASGDYAFANLPAGGDYAVTPSRPGYAFSPAARTFNGLGADQTAPFVVTPASYTVGGRVTSGGAALPGVAVTLSGSPGAAATTDANGAYSFSVSSEGSYTVSVSKRHYTFAPQSLSFTDPLSNKTADFAATLNRHKITGRVARADGRAMSGVTLTLSGAQAATATTDANGDYAFTSLPAGADYAVTPSKPGYDFSPAARTFNGLAADQSAAFVVTPATYTVGGRVTSGGAALSGVTVALSGSRSAAATTGADGAYSFDVSSEGSYTVTPSKQHYAFAPQGLSFADPLSNKTADFTATLNRHKITGRVARADGQAMPGVAVTLSGAQAATATTDAGGNYSFTSLPAGADYAVTPSRPGYDFAPGSKSFAALGADQAADFTVTPATYTVGGRVTSGGAALPGVAVTLSGSPGATATTGADGAYSFSVSSEGSYTVSVSKQHYTFAPQSLSFTDPLSNKTADFAATLNRHKITGRVARADGRAMSGVTLTLSGAQAATATTDANGDYAFTSLPAGADYAVTPSKPGYDFAPGSKSFAALGADQAADFTVTPATYTVGGRITSGGAALSGVTVALSGSRSGTATTGADGAYSFDVSSEGNYTVTPSKQHYAFAPQGLSFADPLSNKTADFAATLNRHTVSGRVTREGGAGLAGATVTLSGSQTASATTDAGGNYAFQNLAAGGDYTVTASKTNYTLGPASAAFNDLGSDRTADFTATPVNFIVSGRVTSGGAALPGVTVTLTGPQTATATTDADGAYSFSVPAEADYVVTPSRKHYSFSPASASLGALDGNKAADFAATLARHAVRGRVADPNNYSLSGVSVTLSGSESATTTTDAGGEFSFPNLAAGGSYTVTPAAPTLAFSPASQTFADLGADAYVAHVGTLARYHVAGRVTEQGAPLAGVTMELSGTHPALGAAGGRFTTGDDGSYSFEVLAGGDYAVTPSKKNYSFGPAAAVFDDVVSDGAADFAATPLPTVAFGAASYAVAEDGGRVTVTVTRPGDATREITVVYQALGDTARRGADFLASIGQLTFAPGETSKTFDVFITDDAFVEGSESFTLTLTPAEGASEGEAAAARVTIGDNDTAAAALNPVDGDEFFVRQHYRDFFSREPDAEGLAFWTGEINRCGADAACREARRVSVSAAFFLSIEFQETGFLVYRLYKAAYGRAPERVREFMLDARVMGDGVVVGRAGWEQKLAANKAASARVFVERPQFAALYPATMTPEQFVDALFLSAGVTPSTAEREAAVDHFGGAATSADGEARAFALRRVAEHPALARAELNRAFVMMQYFGYLRRGPDEAPDTNLDGYNYWLGKLVDFGGDYQKAEMVRAFLASAEYRNRFGN